MLELVKDKKNINLIVALGNFGREYLTTRHNTGFLFADRFTDYLQNQGFIADEDSDKLFHVTVFKEQDLQILKPLTMMNNSGKAVSEYLKYHVPGIFKPSILLVHDDLDIKLGEYKLQYKHSPKNHNGVISVEQEMSSNDFYRLRIGIDNRDLQTRPYGIDYVLSRFEDEELRQIYRIFDRIIQLEFKI